MTPEFLARIFEPFTQESPGARSSYEGTGLGMSIAKKPAQPQVDLAGMNLLMAEDNELNAEIASTLRGRAVPVR